MINSVLEHDLVKSGFQMSVLESKTKPMTFASHKLRGQSSELITPSHLKRYMKLKLGAGKFASEWFWLH